MPKPNEPICICSNYHAEDGACGFADDVLLEIGIIPQDDERDMCMHTECPHLMYEAQDDYHQLGFWVFMNAKHNMRVDNIFLEACGVCT